MDTIYLHGITVECLIGAWEWERRITQQVVIDLDMQVDTKRAAASDDVKDALNYSEVSKHVAELVRQSRFHLIEAMAEAVAAAVLKEFGVSQVRVRVEKSGAVSSAARVGVVIERGEKAS